MKNGVKYYNILLVPKHPTSSMLQFQISAIFIKILIGIVLISCSLVAYITYGFISLQDVANYNNKLIQINSTQFEELKKINIELNLVQSQLKELVEFDKTLK